MRARFAPTQCDRRGSKRTLISLMATHMQAINKTSFQRQINQADVGATATEMFHMLKRNWFMQFKINV